MANENATRLLKFSMFIKRRPELTEDEFHRYWTENHGPIADRWLAKHGIVRYVQYHLRSDLRAQSKVLHGLGDDHILDFDGQIEFLLPSIGHLEKALNEPYYKQYLEPDNEKFIDGPSSFTTLGWEEVFIQNGVVLREK